MVQKTVAGVDEVRWVKRFVFIFLCLTWLPYFVAFLLTPPHMSYMWLLGNPDDQNVHLMWARQAGDCAFGFKDLYTTERHQGMFFHLPAFLIGKLHAITKLPLHILYQLMRTIAVYVLLIYAYKLASLSFEQVETRRAFILFLCFSSGFGWLSWVCRNWLGLNAPQLVDFSEGLVMPEAITFLTALVAPLTALGIAMQVFVITSLISYTLERKPSQLILAGLVSLLLGNAHTYAAITMLVFLLLWCPMHLMWSTALRKIWKACGTGHEGENPLRHPTHLTLGVSVVVAVVCASIGMLPQLLAFMGDIAFREKALTPTLTPPLSILAGSYGLLTPLSLIGLVFGVINRWHMMPMVVAWSLGTLIAIYLPVSFQRKLIEGFHIPLCLLSAYAMSWICAAITRASARMKGEPSYELSKLTYVGAIILTLLMLPSNVAYISLNMRWLLSNNILAERLLQPPYYLTHNQLRLMNWIRENSTPQDSVLCSPMLGNYIPPLTGRAVFIGHWAETLHFVRKLRTIMSCYKWQWKKEQLALWLSLVKEHNVRFVVVTDFERGMVGGDVSLPPFCKLAVKFGSDAVYNVDVASLISFATGLEQLRKHDWEKTK
jgi:hypothetical protein